MSTHGQPTSLSAAPVVEAPADTVLELLTSAATRTPDAPALVAPGRPPLSYSGLLQQALKTVDDLRALGINRNDRVAIVLPNGPEMAASFLTVAAAATCAPLNPAYRANEFEFYLTDTRAKALLIAAGAESPAREVAKALRIPAIDVHVSSSEPAGTFDLKGDRTAAGAAPDLAAADDVALILHTSGTTSKPKIVPLTQRNLRASAGHIAKTLQLTPGDRCLNVMPLFHIHGLMGALMSSMTAGASVVCSPGFDAERFFEWLDRYEPTWYTAVPTMHQAVLTRVAHHRDVVARRQLRLIRSSSASLPPTVMAELEAAFRTQVIESYGMTEASHQMASNPLAPKPRKPGSVGVAAGPEVAIMDAAGNLLPKGSTGEIVIRGPNVTSGYEANPTGNAAAFTRGWFRTGDQGAFDEDGYLFLTGRLKEMINRGGEKIAPREIDDVLLQHPDVAQALSFALPHPTLGEDVGAVVVVRRQSTTPAEIREFAAEKLAAFKVPAQVLIVDEIPKGPTGKPQRIGLAEKLADQLAAARHQDSTQARNATELQLVEIWRELLRHDQFGVRDNFFLIGGDSLATATLLTAIEARFAATIPIDAFLQSPTIETLSGLIDNRAGAGKGATAAQPPTGRSTDDRFFSGIRNRLFQILALYAPGYQSTRVWLHRMRGVTIGSNVSIGLGALIETAYPSLVKIGNNVSLGMRVIIIGHLRDSTSQARLHNQHTVRIEDDVYIGPGVIILPNVTIGQGAVISAGSVVSRSVSPKTLVRGNPAEPIARCSVSLGGGVSYEEFVKGLTPIGGQRLS
jgi:acyl-CoA synthetase (AMP-forming)/AMP-acid ligase II/acetyltransferase-like isoleucine patch superfamily enzyme/acyl carrier protein